MVLTSTCTAPSGCTATPDELCVLELAGKADTCSQSCQHFVNEVLALSQLSQAKQMNSLCLMLSIVRFHLSLNAASTFQFQNSWKWRKFTFVFHLLHLAPTLGTNLSSPRHFGLSKTFDVRRQTPKVKVPKCINTKSPFRLQRMHPRPFQPEQPTGE